MEDGRWRMDYGRWKMEDDYELWIMDYGLWIMEDGITSCFAWEMVLSSEFHIDHGPCHGS